MTFERFESEAIAAGQVGAQEAATGTGDSVPEDHQRFILDYGYRARARDLAAVLACSIAFVDTVRATGACTRRDRVQRGTGGLDFAALFVLRNGRPPADAEWPAPEASPKGRYEWLSPEVALLASMVGQMGVREIAGVLTQRLRLLSGNQEAERGAVAVQVRINRIGLQATDVLGGITTAAAAREIGSLPIVMHAIDSGALAARRIERLWVIPHDKWSVWKAARTAAPDGTVRLSTLREDLGIKSDKLSEFARMGHIPTAVRCATFGMGGPTTQFGTWYVDKAVADKMLADRKAGRPMPWHGKPLGDNLRVTYRRWQARQHPASCQSCKQIWGDGGAPAVFDGPGGYVERYPPLEHGAKRHLTRAWDPGLTVKQIAASAGKTVEYVRQAIDSGMLATEMHDAFLGAPVAGRTEYGSRTDVTRWITRKCPSGESDSSWMSLESACKQHLFTMPELKRLIADGSLNSKLGTDGGMRGIVYVSRHQVGSLREGIGFTVEQAARRVGVTVERLNVLLEGLQWRQVGSDAATIPLVTLQAVIKRLESREGYTLDEAANKLVTSVAWVKERIADGTVRVSRAKWDQRRLYITAPMFARLEAALLGKIRAKPLSSDWLHLHEAVIEAGVCGVTIGRWAVAGELDRTESLTGWRYHRDAVRAKARSYWASVRFKRAVVPQWLVGETLDKV